ncbi:class I SAM-dependent methyltransferase, partial [Rugosimonospora africana]|uniref:class I SAM-dependent methyltransferase n=1 Tax=Rugosimonospora africana TaxID=556532 RepID=UPI00194523FE
MPQPLDEALAEIRTALLDRAGLRRAVAAGRRRGTNPEWVRAELRPVTLKRGDQLQVVTSNGSRPATRNLAWGSDAEAAVDGLLAQPFGNWHVETASGTLQLRVTKRGEAQLHRSDAVAPVQPTGHDREKAYLLDPGDPLYDAIGGNAAKRRQVDAFLRALASTVDEPVRRIVDLGCGNAYLTFAAYRYFASRGEDVEIVGVDVREDQRVRNAALAETLGCADRVRFVAGTIAGADVDGADVVLALHACDTATDDALARAVRWDARFVLAAPCCHHDIAAQLRGGAAPDGYQQVVRQPILRERFADVLTDALRAALLRLHGYRVDVVEFVDSRHTPRNVLLRARRTGAPPTEEQRAEYASLVGAWNITPALAKLLHASP